MDKIPFCAVPRLDFILNKDELLLKSSKRPESPEEFIVKKRKLSDYSENSTNTKNESLNESFSNLTLVNHGNVSLQQSEVRIPKPVRPCNHSQFMMTSSSKSIMAENENVFKKFAIEKNFKQTEENSKRTHSFFKSPNSKNATLFYLPFGVPVNLLDLMMKTENNKMHEERVRFIGPLTEKERNEKLTKFREKKKNRKWKSIRYNIRKDLADQRERFQGRFVKTNRSACFYAKGTTEQNIMMGSVKI